MTSVREPTIALRAMNRLFDNIQVDPAWVRKVQELGETGSLVYVQRNLNFIDFFALEHLTKRQGLPAIQFTNELGLGVFNPFQKGWLRELRRSKKSPPEELKAALRGGGSANLFLKRPPSMLDVVTGASRGRGVSEGDDLIAALFDLQREQERPILLLPQVFVWTKRPDTRGTQPLDFLLGPREWPSPLRTVGQFLYNYQFAELRAGEPLNLRHYLQDVSDISDGVRVRRVTYAMLRRVERERRSVTGPAAKPPDRVREEIIRSPKLQDVISDLAGERPEDRAILAKQALDMLKQLQATPESTTLKGLEVTLHRVFQRIYAGIDYDPREVEEMRELSKDGSLVLLPSHKSHIDYLILSYVFNEENLQLPLIAAGDNLGFFPLGPVLRRGGAFFIRRSFRGDRLYTTVVDAYIRRLIRDGFPIEVFLEGGRSRNGKLLPPKLGLLNMIVEAALSVTQRSTYFVPVSIGYERIVETGAYERELSGGEKSKEDTAGLLRSTKVLRHRYGRINLQFGTPLSLSQLRGELSLPTSGELKNTQRRALVRRLGNRVMDEINHVTAVTPGALTALGLLSHDKRGIAHPELVQRCRRLALVLAEEGARFTPAVLDGAGQLRGESIREAVSMFASAGFVEQHQQEGDGPEVPQIYTIADDKRLALDTTKNMIVHFFVERALVAVALRPELGQPASQHTVRDRVQKLSRLFKFEFRFHADKSFDDIFSETLAAMQSAGEVSEAVGNHLEPGPGREGWTGREWLVSYARMLRNFLEGYRVATRGLMPLVKGPLAEKDLVKKALATGNRMFLAGEIDHRESISKPLVQNAYLALADQGYLRHSDGKLELGESFRSQVAVRAIESRIAGYLRHGGDQA